MEKSSNFLNNGKTSNSEVPIDKINIEKYRPIQSWIVLQKKMYSNSKGF